MKIRVRISEVDYLAFGPIDTRAGLAQKEPRPLRQPDGTGLYRHGRSLCRERPKQDRRLLGAAVWRGEVAELFRDTGNPAEIQGFRLKCKT